MGVDVLIDITIDRPVTTVAEYAADVCRVDLSAMAPMIPRSDKADVEHSRGKSSRSEGRHNR